MSVLEIEDHICASMKVDGLPGEEIGHVYLQLESSASGNETWETSLPKAERILQQPRTGHIDRERCILIPVYSIRPTLREGAIKLERERQRWVADITGCAGRRRSSGE